MTVAETGEIVRAGQQVLLAVRPAFSRCQAGFHCWQMSWLGEAPCHLDIKKE